MYIGVDIVEIKKVQKLLERKGYIHRIFTTKELEIVKEYSDIRKAQSLAGKFAAKEAAVKALGTGFDEGILLTDVEITNQENGKPILILHNKAEKKAKELKISRLNVSISHCEAYAVGMVVLEEEGNHG